MLTIRRCVLPERKIIGIDPGSSTKTVHDNRSAVNTGASPSDIERFLSGYESHSDTSSSWWSTDCSDIAPWVMKGDGQTHSGC